jgi:hypothetical protein
VAQDEFHLVWLALFIVSTMVAPIVVGVVAVLREK